MSVSVTPSVNATGIRWSGEDPTRSHNQPATQDSSRGLIRVGLLPASRHTRRNESKTTATKSASSNTENGVRLGFSPHRSTPWAFKPKVRAGS